MEITILGRWGAYPEGGEATAGYLMEHEETSLLLDCGSGVLSLLQERLPIANLQNCLVTHYHHDHVADLGVLGYAVMLQSRLGTRKTPFTLYLPKEPAQEKERYLDIPGAQIVEISPEEEISIGGIRFSFLKTVHPIYTLAVKAEWGEKSWVYTSDTSFFEGLIPFVKGAELLLAESNFYLGQDGSKAGHMNAGEVGRLAKEGEVKKVVITHLPHVGKQEDLVQQVRSVYPGPVYLAKFGDRYVI
ncbi:MAG: MBL fold metallo-hydrolase [Thermicanus sp.]|nr:MBL fold metallo-hydrolase [Thermicanus sp.]